jgi:arylsulfatase A-like enzyme
VTFRSRVVNNPVSLTFLHINQLSPGNAMIRLVKLFTAVLFTLASTVTLPAAGTATHVVVVVWDGMRPDFVTPATTPTLCNLAKRGVTFRNHHAAYPSMTEVNGTALATGAYPGESGIIANREFRPAFNASKRVGTEELAVVREGDEITGGHYLNSPTVAEILRSHGMRTAIAGAKGVALLHDRAARSEASEGVNLYAGSTLPESSANVITGLLGQFPAADLTGTNRDLWTRRALTGPLWEQDVPAFSLLWLSEPDHSQHETGPGSPTSLAAIKHADQNLAQVLAALDQKGLRDTTDVIVVSDHGFSTIDQNVDVAAVLTAQGFHAGREFPRGGARGGDVMVVGNGGTVLLYVAGHDQTLIAKVVHCLQTQTFCGVLFTREPVEGAFRLHDARIDSPAAPDIVLAMHWKADESTNGAPGLVYSDYSQYGPGCGMHGSLSPFDMHNACIAAGPDFRKGAQDDLPSGNIDIAPTVLWLLGVVPEHKPSGRVLREALTQPGNSPPPPCETRRLEASFRSIDSTWHQYLECSEINGVLYFDQGNGVLVPRQDIGGN